MDRIRWRGTGTCIVGRSSGPAPCAPTGPTRRATTSSTSASTQTRDPSTARSVHTGRQRLQHPWPSPALNVLDHPSKNQLVRWQNLPGFQTNFCTTPPLRPPSENEFSSSRTNAPPSDFAHLLLFIPYMAVLSFFFSPLFFSFSHLFVHVCSLFKTIERVFDPLKKELPIFPPAYCCNQCFGSAPVLCGSGSSPNSQCGPDVDLECQSNADP